MEMMTWPGWEMVKVLGEGSFGKVYHIRKTEYGQTYDAALKVITVSQSQADLDDAYEQGQDENSISQSLYGLVEEIVAEVALMNKLKGNSHIVSYEDHMVVPHEGEIGWDIMIRMELLTPLMEYIRKEPLTENDVVRLGIHMAKALKLCHESGIIHRDIKPQNIFITERGDFKLGDFGVARVSEKTTAAMSKKGTYSYMAPEVYNGRKYGYKADLYSLGLVLYRYLNDNRLPFMPPAPAPIGYKEREKAMADRISGRKPLPEPAHGSEALKAVVMKACAHKVTERYASAEELEEALWAVKNGGMVTKTAMEKAGLDEVKTPENSFDISDMEEKTDKTVSVFDRNPVKQQKQENKNAGKKTERKSEDDQNDTNRFGQKGVDQNQQKTEDLDKTFSIFDLNGGKKPTEKAAPKTTPKAAPKTTPKAAPKTTSKTTSKTAKGTSKMAAKNTSKARHRNIWVTSCPPSPDETFWSWSITGGRGDQKKIWGTTIFVIITLVAAAVIPYHYFSVVGLVLYVGIIVGLFAFFYRVYQDRRAYFAEKEKEEEQEES